MTTMLRNVEIFYVAPTHTPYFDELGERLPEGWYWWTCCPGCLPDSDAYGPFETRRDAVRDAAERDEE